MPVLHASGERYVSDSAESDTLGVRDGMSDDAQPTVVTPFITPSAEASQTTPVRKSETANSLFRIRGDRRQTGRPHRASRRAPCEYETFLGPPA